MNELDKNQAVAEAICRDFAWKGHKFQPGEHVALLNGDVVAVMPDMEQALQALRSIEPDPHKGMLVEVARPIVEVIR